MPLEIRELIIRVNIEKDTVEKAVLPREDMDELKNEIIRECMDVMLSRLNSLTER